MRSLEPLPGGLDAARWRGVALCLLVLLDQVAKNMLVLKDALVADLLAYLEDVEAAGVGMAAAPMGPVPAQASGGGEAMRQQTVASQARGLRAILMQISE